MTLTAESVVALVCRECEADLRGAPKVQDGDAYLCATCAMRREWQRDRDRQSAPPGESA